MSTLADELLNDFEDSGSEGEGEAQNGFLQDEQNPAVEKSKLERNGTEMDVDEDADEDEEMANGDALKELEDADDENEAKARVEKMQLGAVDDVRSVAGLMKTLEPVLEVSLSSKPSLPLFKA